MSKLAIFALTITLFLSSARLEESIKFDIKVAPGDMQKLLSQYNQDDARLFEAMEHVDHIVQQTRKISQAEGYKALDSALMTAIEGPSEEWYACLASVRAVAANDPQYMYLKELFENMDQLRGKHPAANGASHGVQIDLKDAQRHLETLQSKYAQQEKECGQALNEKTGPLVAAFQDEVAKMYKSDFQKSIQSSLEWLSQGKEVFRSMRSETHDAAMLPVLVVEFVEGCFNQAEKQSFLNQLGENSLGLADLVRREIGARLSIADLIEKLRGFVAFMSKNLERRPLEFTVEAESVSMTATSEERHMESESLVVKGTKCSVFKLYRNVRPEPQDHQFDSVSHSSEDSGREIYRQALLVSDAQEKYFGGQLHVEKPLSQPMAGYFMALLEKPEHVVSKCWVDLWNNGTMVLNLEFARKAANLFII